MKKDTLFDVTIDNGTELVFGLVKAETLEDAIVYVRREYAGYNIESIEESRKVLL